MANKKQVLSIVNVQVQTFVIISKLHIYYGHKIGGELRVKKYQHTILFRPADNDRLWVIYVNVFLDMGFWTTQLGRA